MTGALEQRLSSYIEQRVEHVPSGCLIWTGGLRTNGYVGISLYAHRIVWELHRGPIPDGLVVDHMCRCRVCLNPEHMRVVTHDENIMSGSSPSAWNARKTHCMHGHPWSEENTYFRPASSVRGVGTRQCRACGAESKRRAKEASRGS